MDDSLMSLSPCAEPSPSAVFALLDTSMKEAWLAGRSILVIDAADMKEAWLAGRSILVIDAADEYVNIDGTVYRVVGEHLCRRKQTRVCLQNVLTGANYDTPVDAYEINVNNDVWDILNEMEALAWVTGQP